MKKLTPKQQRFVEEYLIDLNATQAAIRAGYSEKTARQIAGQNLTKLDIASAIAERRSELTAEVKVDQAFVVRGLAEIASYAPDEFPETMRMSDKRQALVDLGKWQGMFVEKVEVAGMGEFDRLERARQRTLENGESDETSPVVH